MTPATTPADGEMLPCPMCGSPNITIVDLAGWEVWCSDCGVQGAATNPKTQRAWDNKNECAAAWNRRATPSPGKADAEDGWLRDFIDERRRIAYSCLELRADEVANINLFLDELEKAWRSARA